MYRIFKIATLTLITITAVICLAACGSSQSGGASPTSNGFEIPKNGQLPDSPTSGDLPSGGQPPANVSGMPSGMPSNLPGSSSAKPTIQVEDQTNTVFGNGTIKEETYANLYFGSAGQISAINVKQGEYVTKGTVLAKMDTLNLEASLAQAKVALNEAELAQIQAGYNLATAQFNLDQIEAVGELKNKILDIQTKIIAVKENARLASADGDSSSSSRLSELNTELDRKNTDLQKLLAKDEYSGVASYETMVYDRTTKTYYMDGETYDQLVVEDIQIKQLAVESAQQVLDQSQDTINLAQKNLDVIQDELNKATITAPFDGIVANVNQDAGDFISAPAALQSPVIYIIDPTSYQVVIGVNELDVPKIKIGQSADISIDAYPDLKLKGQVSSISPVETLKGLVVNYEVKINFSEPADVQARIGMNATATLTIE